MTMRDNVDALYDWMVDRICASRPTNDDIEEVVHMLMSEVEHDIFEPHAFNAAGLHEPLDEDRWSKQHQKTFAELFLYGIECKPDVEVFLALNRFSAVQDTFSLKLRCEINLLPQISKKNFASRDLQSLT